jgi:hypothetical protein
MNRRFRHSIDLQTLLALGVLVRNFSLLNWFVFISIRDEVSNSNNSTIDVRKKAEKIFDTNEETKKINDVPMSHLVFVATHHVDY